MTNSENTVLLAMLNVMDDMLELDKVTDKDRDDILKGINQLKGIVDRIAERNNHGKDFCVQSEKDISS